MIHHVTMLHELSTLRGIEFVLKSMIGFDLWVGP